ncbi:MAG: cytochrome c oxidase accessory protein CcoG [Gammaproteobacteria bacterium]
MSDEQAAAVRQSVDELYAEADYWHVNTGGETIHAKRVGGRWRTLKWLTHAVWLVYFFGPYLRWGDRQAVLFDIPERQFHIFSLTVLPQDFWMLSLLLLFFAILLAVVTALAGRVWCGFFCFQTVWTDLYTLIEDRLEGPPPKRRALDKAPLDARKITIKGVKHLLWLLIAVFTGISFVAWFTDAWLLWKDLFALQAHPVAWTAIGLFTAGTYVLAGWMREQVCFWLCPYARLQGVMYDAQTVLPTYDYHRGEPRGRLKKGHPDPDKGDCIDCKQCVAVCPTGIDIRHGQQEGCITCALCIDACDSVMSKIGKPRGLIRYASLEEMQGKPVKPFFKRGRVWVYGGIMTAALVGIVVGLSTVAPLELKVLHERQPLFVLQSDGSIQNKYTLKVLNKTDREISVTISASGPQGLVLVDADRPVTAQAGKVTPATVFARIPRQNLASDSETLTFHVQSVDNPDIRASRDTLFAGPRR